MTENKRFEWILMEFWDNVSDEPLSYKEIEKRINALVDENNRLKKKIKSLEDANEGLTETIAHLDVGGFMDDKN